MTIFDFLKKMFKGEKGKGKTEAGGEKTEKEKIPFSDVKDYIENKRKEIEIKEKDIFLIIKNRINILGIETKEKIDILKKVDINSKKGNDKLKFAVEEGRKKYIELLECLLIDLNNLQEDRLERTIFSIDKLFSDFNKNSHINYEKATILIGKEMEDIRTKLKVFSKGLIEIFDENKDIATSSQTISSIELKLRQSEKIKEEIEKINQSMLSLDKEINLEEEQNKKSLEEIERIKKNPEYLEYLKRVERAKSLEKDLEKDMHTLRQLIDFKALGSFYHIFEDKMRIVNLYREDFQKKFQEDDGKEISDLLKTAKLFTENISDIIKKINTKKEEIMKDRIQNEKDGQTIQTLHSDSSNMISRIDSLKNEKSKEEKRLKKLNTNEKEIINDIKKEAEKIGVCVD